MRQRLMQPSLIRQLLALTVLAALVCAVPVTAAPKKAPVPSDFPIAWQLDFKHGIAKRIVVGTDAYWYLTYTVTNNTGREQIWAPDFEMLTNDGKVIKSDHLIPGEVFDRIKGTERSRFLEPANRVAGNLHQGEDQAKDGVAIWREPNPRMGEFQIFVHGLSGEAVKLTDDDGKELKNDDGTPIFLRKTLQLNYAVYGDEFYPQRHEVHDLGETWVMR
jgi:hypothetical protein